MCFMEKSIKTSNSQIDPHRSIKLLNFVEQEQIVEESFGSFQYLWKLSYERVRSGLSILKLSRRRMWIKPTDISFFWKKRS